MLANETCELIQHVFMVIPERKQAHLRQGSWKSATPSRAAALIVFAGFVDELMTHEVEGVEGID